MAKKKSIAKKKGRPAKSTTLETFSDWQNDIGVFTIETKPPMPSFKGSNLSVAVLPKVDSIIDTLQVGQAFLIPAEHRAGVRKHITDMYPTKVFLINDVADNEAVKRIYLIKELNANGK